MFKFYINDIEINEPINWRDIRFELIQDDKYFGFFGVTSIEDAEFIRDTAKMLRHTKLSGINPFATFRIDKKSSMGIYNEYKTYDILFPDYKEELKNGQGFSVKIKLRDNNNKNKLRVREGLDLIIGRNKSVENKDINGFDLIEANILRKKIRFATTWKWTDYLQKTSAGSPNETPAADFHNASQNLSEVYKAHWGLELINSNDPNATSSTHEEFSGGYTPSLAGMIFNESNVEREVTLKGSFDMQLACARSGSGSYDAEYEIKFFLAEFVYDTGINAYDKVAELTSMILAITIPSYAPVPSSTFPLGGLLDGFFPTSNDRFIDFNINFPIDIVFTKKAKRTYAIMFKYTKIGSTSEDLKIYGVLQKNGSNYLSTYFDDNLNEYPESKHRGAMVYESLKSLLEQQTDKVNIFNSNFFGRTDLGYAENGEGSGIFITDGLLLRNAVDTNDTPTNLVLQFEKLYKTLDAIYGLQMFYENGKIHIEKRDWTRNKVIKLTYRDISTVPLNDKIFGAIKVGNNKVKLEDVNGTNEFNSISNFTVPIQGDNNVLDLVTEYNTDYTPVEYARRLVYVKAESLDSMFDDKVFLIAVELIDGVWTTKTVADKYDIINGIINPNTAFNLEFSPKRMMLNNRDFIDSLMYNSNGELVRFEKSEDLAALISRKNSGNIITEQTDFIPDVSKAKYKPFLYQITGSVINPEEKFINRNNLYEFEYLGEIVRGYLWQIKDAQEETLIEILPKAIN